MIMGCSSAHMLGQLMGSAAAVACVTIAVPAAAQARSFDVSAQSASKAIPSFARQAGIQLIARAKDVRGKRTNAVRGTYSTDEALRLLLAGTGLAARRDAGTGITKVQAVGNGGQSAGAEASPPPPPESGDEVVVTANKREERLVEVAGSVSAVTGRQLEEMGAQSLTDYITKLPGVHFNDYVPGRSEVAIRGISTTTYHVPSQPVVAYYINDIPLTEPGFPVLIPDVDTFDLNRVEVLRGPQGSLFGSASLGGALNYLVNEADPSKVDAAIELSVGATRHSDGQANHTAKGMINIPLVVDRIAIRAVAYQRSDAGYIEDVQLGTKGVNDTRVRGLRGSLVFTPASGTKITLTSMYQELVSDNQPYVTLGTYTRANFIEDPQSNKFQLYSARLDQDLGFATLTLLGSRSVKDGVVQYDQTVGTIPYTGLNTSAYEVMTGHARAWYGEARLASAAGGAFRWLIGANYTTSTNDQTDQIVQPGLVARINANPLLFPGVTGSSIAPGDRLLDGASSQKNKDFAVFGEVGFKPVPQLELSAGGRFYDVSSDGRVNRGADFYGYLFATPTTLYNAKQSGTGFSPTASIAYRPNRNLTIFAKYARGFRVGGPNPNPPGVTGLPLDYGADSANNYEVGMHALAMDRRLNLDVSVFRIDWDNIQVRQFTAQNFSYVANAGGARSEGVEFAGSIRVVQPLTLSTAITYQNARLTEFLPYLYATNGLGGYPVGTRLPGASEWTVSNNAVLSFEDAPLTPSFAISHRYLSKAPVSFQATLPRGGYSLFDARLSISASENVDLMVFVNNIFDKYGLLSAPFSDGVPNPQGTATRPRTVGLRLNWHL